MRYLSTKEIIKINAKVILRYSPGEMIGIKKHPFHNGNKRTALVAMLLFLQLNNCSVAFSRQEAVDFIIMITTSSLDFDSLKSKITNYLRQTAIK